MEAKTKVVEQSNYIRVEGSSLAEIQYNDDNLYDVWRSSIYTFIIAGVGFGIGHYLAVKYLKDVRV